LGHWVPFISTNAKTILAQKEQQLVITGLYVPMIMVARSSDLKIDAVSDDSLVIYKSNKQLTARCKKKS
jgi:hypothetical protein